MATQIFADKTVKKQKNFWNHILFHPTDAIEDDWGQVILNHIAEDRAAKTVRIYSMMEDITSLDENGVIHYDFALNDLRLDYLLGKGFTPMIAYAGIPAWLAQDESETTSVSHNKTRYKGKMWITSPPKDYSLWEEICREYTRHIIDRYGEEQVAGWHLHCFNEPDIPSFFMKGRTVEERCVEYCKLYDAFEKGVTSISKKLTIGGPALANKVEFLDQFLKDSVEKNRRLDYICVHNYGVKPPHVDAGEVTISVDHQFEFYDAVQATILKYYPEGKELVQDEWGAMTRGFAPASKHPCVLFRETEKFSAYYAMMLTRFAKEYDKVGEIMICLSGQHEMTSEFEGFRNFYSLHFIKKPIYNAHVMAAKLLENILEDTTDTENLQLLATGNESGKIAVLFSYGTNDFDEGIENLNEKVVINGLSGKKKISVYKIDEENTNPYRVWQKKGWEEHLSAEQIEELKAVSDLKAQEQSAVADGKLEVEISLTRNGVLLMEVEDAE